MADKIKLTPQELLAQSQEMSGLQKEYDELFLHAQNTLTEVNANWSADLARNFTGKLFSTQKSFLKLSEMLGQGDDLAATSARTYESVDSLLAKVMEGSGSITDSTGSSVTAVESSGPGAEEEREKTNEEIRQQLQQQLGGMAYMFEDSFIESYWSGDGDKGILEKLYEKYVKIPKPVRKELEKFLSDQLGPVYHLYNYTFDWITGDVGIDTGEHMVKAVAGGKIGAAVKYAFDYAFKWGKDGENYMDIATEYYDNGHPIAGFMTSMYSVIDQVVFSVQDVLINTFVIDTIDDIPGFAFAEEVFGFDLSEDWDGFTDGVQEVYQEVTHQVTETVAEIEEAI